MRPILLKPQFPTEENVILETMRQCMFQMIDNGALERRASVRKKDTIDVSGWARETLGNDYTSMPPMSLKENELIALHDNWCLGIPPFLEGVLLLNKDRYLVFEVTDIDMENKSYKVTLIDYASDHGIWILNVVVVATITVDMSTQFNYDEVTNYDYIKGMFVDHVLQPKIYLDNKLYDNVVNRLLPFLKECIEDDNKENTPMARSALNHFYTSIVKVNMELMNGPKPKAIKAKGTKSKVKTVTDKVPEKNPKPQIVRTLSSGVTIKSARVPKAPTVDIVRHYKVASWNVRGHMRHYKTGKVVYIPPRVAKRKEFENTDAAKRQTIIVSGSKTSKLFGKEIKHEQSTNQETIS